MSKLFRKGETIKHLFIYISVVKNHQDRFKERGVQMNAK